MVKEIDVTDIDEIDRMWPLKHINVQEAWKHTKGEHSKIAILDSGASLDHPDLKGNIIEHKDFTKSRRGAEDVNGHGSHVAGIVAAIEDGKGVVGVAPQSKLYIGKVLKDNGKGNYASIINGVKWAIKKDVDIITMSFGSRKEPPGELIYLLRKAYKQGIIIISAAGNSNEDVAYPAALEEVIAVSAVNKENEKASYSNYGIANEISAPGSDVLSTYKNKGYAILSGTSMATPLVSGAAALFVSYFYKIHKVKPCSDLTRDFLNKSVIDAGEEGRDIYYGTGILDLSNFKEVIENLNMIC